MKRLSQLKLIHVIKALEIALGISIISFMLFLDNWENIALYGFFGVFANYIAHGATSINLCGILLGAIRGSFFYCCCNRAKAYREKRRIGVILDCTVIGVFVLDALLALLTWRQAEELMALPAYSLVYDCIVISFFAFTMRYRKAYAK